MGLIYDKEGARPNPQRVEAIEAIEAPQSLQEFLGIATYMAPFIPKLSMLTAPLRELMKKDAEFEWTPSHQAAFINIKKMMAHEVTLALTNRL